MQAVPTCCMVSRTIDPIPERMATGIQSTNHASTRVSHGVYCRVPRPPSAAEPPRWTQPPPGGGGTYPPPGGGGGFVIVDPSCPLWRQWCDLAAGQLPVGV